MTDVDNATLTERAAPSEPSDLSVVVVNLCKGPLYREANPRAWELLDRLRPQVSDYVGSLGLDVVMDEAEGYAFLRSQPRDDGPGSLPRLIARRPLSFAVSVLLALLRKRLAEFDARSAETRLVLSREQVIEMVRLFLPSSSNDVKLVDQADTVINKVLDLGFVVRLRGAQEMFEVRRILKAYIDGQWLADLDGRLAEYLGEIAAEGEPEEEM